MLRLHRTVGRTPSSALNHRLRSPTMRWTRGSSSEAVSLLPLRIVTPLEVAFRAQAVVATPAICMDHAARLDGVEHKCVEALGGGVRYLPQPDTPDALPILLRGNDNQSWVRSSNLAHFDRLIWPTCTAPDEKIPG